MSGKTRRDDIELAFNGISFANANFAGISANQLMNYSLTAAYVPLRTLNPAEATAGTIARVLATLLGDLNRDRS
jgi:hypothetical protein